MYRKNLTVLVLVLGLIGMAILAAPIFAEDFNIVISEVMYKPDATNSVEWVEIHNKGTASVDLTGWQICDSAGCDTLSGGTIAGGDYWIITEAVDAAALQLEFNTYGGPPTVDVARTIFLNQLIGSNGLGNNDLVYLSNGTAFSDCVSWNGGSTCATASYLAGSDGVDTTGLNGAVTSLGQSIVNIGGVWQLGDDHNPTPNALNVGAGGSPTAISLSEIKTSHTSTLTISAAIIGMFMAILSGWSVMRRKATI